MIILYIHTPIVDHCKRAERIQNSLLSRTWWKI